MDDTTRAAYETLARLENIEDEWAREEAKREGQRYWEVPPEPKPKRERGLDTGTMNRTISEPTRDLVDSTKSNGVILTEAQIEVIGAALSEIRKQLRDEIEVARVESINAVSIQLREELDALRGEVTSLRAEVASLRDKNLVVLPRRYDDAA